MDPLAALTSLLTIEALEDAGAVADLALRLVKEAAGLTGAALARTDGTSIATRAAHGELPELPAVPEALHYDGPLAVVPLPPTPQPAPALPNVLLVFRPARPVWTREERFFLESAARAVGSALWRIERLRQAEAAACTDRLTGLGNRRALERLQEGDSPGGHGALGARYRVLMVDLGGFKALNDALGRQAGDELLARVAELLERELAPHTNVTLLRLQSDEFLALLPEEDAPRPLPVERLREGLLELTRVAQPTQAAEAPPTRERRAPPLSLDLALVRVPEEAPDLAAAVAAADERVHEIKRQRRALRERLERAEQKVESAFEASPDILARLPGIAASLADEVAHAVGANAFGLWELDGERAVRLSGAETPAPDLEALAGPAGQRPLTGGWQVALQGLGGGAQGALVLQRLEPPDAEQRALLDSFAARLGAALEVRRMRQQLATEAADPALKPTFLDRYRIERPLGEGGSGTVYQAWDTRLERPVAIKLMRPHLFRNAVTRARFAHEARAVAAVTHPGVITLHDSGELPDGTAFLITEYLQGSDVGSLVRAFGPGSFAQVACLLRGGAGALAAAHQAGLLHRDIKPENIFLCPAPEPGELLVNLLDFGLARKLTIPTGLTETGMVVGTPAYMSPEQAQDLPLDVRSDLYSFAAVVYEATTGERAVPGEDLANIMHNILVLDPVPPSLLRRALPKEADAAFAAALAKEPGQRPTDLVSWAGELATLVEALPPDGPGWTLRSGGSEGASASTQAVRLETP